MAKNNDANRNAATGVIAQGEAAAKAPAAPRAASPHVRRLGNMLQQAGLVNEEQIRALISSGEESAQSIQKSLIQTGLVREDDLLDVLAEQMHMERIDFEDLKITKDLVEQIEPRLARKYRVFPVRYDAESIHVALSDPLDIQTTDELKMFLNKEVVGCVASEEDISRAIRRYYEGDEISAVYEKTIESQDEGNVERRAGFRDYQNLNLDRQGQGDAQPAVVRFVDMIFRQAVHDRASDIHIEPTRRSTDIRFRIDGVLHHVPSPPKSWEKQILARLKVEAGMDLAEKRIPQDGRIALNVEGRKLDLRVSCLPAIFGESIVMRILDQSSVMLGLEDVGFLPDSIARFERLIKSPNGIILMTGPTGSGKTTTLYSALSTLNDVETKIVTIENPVEYMIPGIVQVQVDNEVGLDFSTGLRSVLRQSPNIILVGEIRDLETAEIAIRAALTGHLVFSTLHTNDAPSSTTRLTNMGIKPYLVGSSLQAVIAQRLVRRVCRQCRQLYTPSEAEMIELGRKPEEIDGVQFPKTVGCERCGNLGYRGRTAIHEIMEMDSELRRMVIQESPTETIRRTAVRKGMRTLRMDGFEKIALHITTFEDVIRITQQDDTAEEAE